MFGMLKFVLNEEKTAKIFFLLLFIVVLLFLLLLSSSFSCSLGFDRYAMLCVLRAWVATYYFPLPLMQYSLALFVLLVF